MKIDNFPTIIVLRGGKQIKRLLTVEDLYVTIKDFVKPLDESAHKARLMRLNSDQSNESDVNSQVVRSSIHDITSEESNNMLGDQIEYLLENGKIKKIDAVAAWFKSVGNCIKKKIV
jgi:hypothetical protein